MAVEDTVRPAMEAASLVLTQKLLRFIAVCRLGFGVVFAQSVHGFGRLTAD